MIYSLLSILFNPPQADCALSSHESPKEFAKCFGIYSGRIALTAPLFDSGI